MVDPVDPLHFTTPYLWITVYRQTCRIFKLRHEKYPGTKNPHFVVFSEIWGLSGYDSGFWPFVFFYNSVGKITNIWKFETTQFQLLPPQKTHHKHTENEPPASEHLADSILWVKNPEGLEGPEKTRLRLYSLEIHGSLHGKLLQKWWNVILGPENSDRMRMLYWGKGSNCIQCMQSIHHHSPIQPFVVGEGNFVSDCFGKLYPIPYI